MTSQRQGWTRRAFVRAAAGSVLSGTAGVSIGCERQPLSSVVGAAEEDGFDAGPLSHLLPITDHARIRLKVSSTRPLDRPVLRVGSRTLPGRSFERSGRFFQFDVGDLEPGTRYTLALEEAGGARICDPWPLSTLPAPDARPERLRLLVFTCAGGPDDLYNLPGFNAYLPMAARRRLLRRALSFAPDVAIANGDHVYWDMKSRFGWAMGRSPRAWWNAGWFDRALPVLGTPNEEVLQRAFGPQVAGLYGGLMRSTPTYFLQDDHDYGENDEASEELRTFPPDPFMLDLARSTQRLYYPELLGGEGLPARHVEADGASPHFGSLRYGRLLEAWLYDCRRHLRNRADPDLAHARSGFVPDDVEAWLVARSRTTPCLHGVHMPSTPVLWTAGKWGEWYPDAKDAEGQLRADAGKPYWAEGWAAQHDRLLQAASSRPDRLPLVVSGDLHATGVGRIHESRGARLGVHPIVSVLSGAVGTGALGWPSQFRDQRPVPSGTLGAEEIVTPVEENGFSLLDVTPDAVRVSQFGWTPDRDPAEIDTLEPFAVVDLPRPGAASG